MWLSGCIHHSGGSGEDIRGQLCEVCSLLNFSVFWDLNGVTVLCVKCLHLPHLTCPTLIFETGLLLHPELTIVSRLPGP